MRKVLVMSLLLLSPVMAFPTWADSHSGAQDDVNMSREAIEHGEAFLQMVEDTQATFDLIRRKVKTLYRTTIHSFDEDSEKMVHDLFVLNAHVSTQIKNLMKCLKAPQTNRFQRQVDYRLTKVTRALFEGQRRRANWEFRKLSMAVRIYNQYFDRMIWAEQYYNWKYCGAPEPTDRLCTHEPCEHCDFPEHCLDRPY